MKNLMILKFITLSIFFNACESSEEGFALFEEVAMTQASNDVEGGIEFESWFPEDDLIQLANTQDVTIGVKVSSASGPNVKYKYYMNEVLLAEDESGFFALNSLQIDEGTNTFKIEAENTVSKNEQVFNLYKNTLPEIISSSPDNKSPLSISCLENIAKFGIAVDDAEKDTLNFNWELNGPNIDDSDMIIATNNQTSDVFLSLDCAKAGAYSLEVSVDDGKDSVAHKWSFNVNDPNANADEPVAIVDFIPLADPVILSNDAKETFVVTVNPGAGSDILYRYLLDDTLLSETNKSFYEIYGNTMSLGNHIFKVVATNSINSTEKTFNIRKNTPPTFVTTSPSASGSSVTCGVGNLTLSATIADVDPDSFSYEWKINGNDVASYFATTNLPASSTAIFTPDCNITGNNTVSLLVNDGYDTTSYSWTIDILNPNVAEILSLSPNNALTIIPSVGTQTFNVSATGSPTLNFQWKLNGADLAGQTSSSISFAPGDLPVGDHSLEIEVIDANNTSDARTMAVRMNAMPSIDSFTPANMNLSMNVDSIKIFNIVTHDDNPSDALSYTWALDGLVSDRLTQDASGTTANFTPNTAQLGDHVISVVVNDGTETNSMSWNVNVNYFSSECNNLSPGQVCTFVGDPEVGHLQKPEDGQSRIRVQPSAVIDDGSGNLFMIDNDSRVVYFYNRSNSDMTLFGNLIRAGELYRVLGVGGPASAGSATSFDQFSLNVPYGLAFDSTKKILYVSDYARHRVFRLNTTGYAEIIMGNVGSGTGKGNNVDGDPATSHKCEQAYGLTVNESADELFVACNRYGLIKKISNASTNTPTAEVVIGKIDGSGNAGNNNSNTGNDNNNSIGSSGSATVRYPRGIVFFEDQLFIYDAGDCQIKVANLSASPSSYLGQTINALSLKAIAGSSCGHKVDSSTGSKMRSDLGTTIGLHTDGSTLKGIFVANYNNHRVGYHNNEAVSVTYGATTIAPNFYGIIWGTGSASYNGDNIVANISRTRYPNAAAYVASRNELILADYNNYRLRSMDLSIGSGLTTNVVGSGYLRNRNSNSNGGNQEASKAFYNRIGDLDIYDTSMYFSELNGHTVQKLNMKTGELESVADRGTGTAYEGLADNVYLYTPQAIVADDTGVLFGQNNRCMISYLNESSNPVSKFGVSIASGYVSTIGGRPIDGCAAWQTSNEGEDILNIRMEQNRDMLKINGELFLVQSDDHCITKVDASGTLTQFIGQCGSVGNTSEGDGLISSGLIKLRQPRAIYKDPRFESDGNFFFVDRYDQGTGKLRYVNRSANPVTVSGITVAPGSVKNIIDTPQYVNGVAAFDSQICFAVGHPSNSWSGKHQISCLNRDSISPSVQFSIGVGATGDSGGRSVGREFEGSTSYTTMRLYSPSKMTFDIDGNLYWVERYANSIKKLARWW
jgi:hypothetical protein